MSVQRPIFLLLSAAVLCKTVRLAVDIEADPDENCVQHVRSTLNSMTYRQTLSPVLEETYILRSQKGDVLLSEQGRLLMSEEAGKKSDWVLEKVPQERFDNSMPKYTIKNRASGGYLSFSSSSPATGRLTAESRQNFEETSDPESLNAHWKIDLRTQGFNIQSAMAVNLAPRELEGSSDGDWSLELQGGKRNLLNRQWEAASQLPVFPGKSHMRWGDLCKISACGDEKYYENEKERQAHLGKIDEEHTSATENFVQQGICGWDIEFIKEFVNNPEVAKEMQSVSKADCPTCSLEDFAASLSQAVNEECFDSCASHLDMLVASVPCENQASIASNWTSVFEQAVQEPKCGLLPPDTLTALAEYRMVRKCMTWHAPSILWAMNDRGVNVAASQHAVCKILPFNKKFSKSPEDIYQKGTCPEGTACDCPEKILNHQMSLAERRDRRFSTFFVTPGSAIVPAILHYVKEDILVKWMVGAILQASVGNVLAPLIMPWTVLEYVKTAYWRAERIQGVVWGNFKKHKKFKCASTAACWAVPPKKVAGNCRVSEAAEEGGSPVWFLPPPLMKVEKKFKICSLKPCSDEEVASQKVGFGGPDGTRRNVYNCQPLIWEDMGEEQQMSLRESLIQTGIKGEYNL